MKTWLSRAAYLAEACTRQRCRYAAAGSSMLPPLLRQSLLRPARRTLSTAAAAAKDIAERGKASGIKFYQFSFLDLFGIQRSKLVPASRVAEIAEDGAGFAGFAAWIDMDPTMGDLLAVPDPSYANSSNPQIKRSALLLICVRDARRTGRSRPCLGSPRSAGCRATWCTTTWSSRTVLATCCAPCRRSSWSTE